MKITVHVRDLLPGDKITTNNTYDWPYGAEVGHVNAGKRWGKVIDRNGHALVDHFVALDRLVEVDRPTSVVDEVIASFRAGLEDLYKKALHDAGIATGDIEPMLSARLEAAEDALAEVVGIWVGKAVNG